MQVLVNELLLMVGAVIPLKGITTQMILPRFLQMKPRRSVLDCIRHSEARKRRTSP